ncbi:MarR family winged helix-turn-helix transcriptional regulator [Compostibacter hankyongensis]|uniref:MarR family transcriptional regulator n=1 Tax=Compostibacter hankyongensis TaxID=1007089 RepID=A0ABP8FFC4_9BACT
MKLETAIRQKAFESEQQKASLNVMYTGNWLNAQTNRLLKPFGLSHQQLNVLRILRGAGSGTNLCEIQERMLDRMSNSTRLVEKLRLKGLVTRDACPENRRKVDIRITQKGLELLGGIDGAIRQMHEGMCTRISAKEAAQLNALLEKMRK